MASKYLTYRSDPYLKFLSSESITSLTPLCSHFVNWKVYLLVSDFKKRHYEQHMNNDSIPHKIWAVQEKIEIVLIFSFFKFWFLIYIQIASNNHNKLMKTLRCTANKSVPRYITYYSLNLTVHNIVELRYVIYSAQIFDITGRIFFMKSVKKAEMYVTPSNRMYIPFNFCYWFDCGWHP